VVTQTENAKSPEEPILDTVEIENIYILKKNSITLIFDTTGKLGGDAQVDGLKAMVNVIQCN